MDVNTIMAMIGSVGFPIVACIGMFWFINKTMKEYAVAMNAFAEVLQRNTTVLEAMKEKL